MGCLHSSPTSADQLHVAVAAGDVEQVMVLCAEVDNVNCRDWKRYTPLHKAVCRGYVDVVRVLLAESADVDLIDHKERTVLYYAAEHGYVDVAEALLSNGANVNGTRYHVTTPLHLAAMKGHADVVTLLVANGAKLSEVRKDMTPLHFAAQSGSIDVAKILVWYGADVKVKNSAGSTPLGLANRETRQAIKKTLERAKVRSLTGHSNEVTSVAFSPYSFPQMVASGSKDNTVKVWDVATGEELKTLTGHKGGVIFVEFSPDGQQLVSGSRDTVKVWDVATGKETESFKLKWKDGHNISDYSVVAFSTDGKQVAAAKDWRDNNVHVFDVATGDEIQTLIGHLDNVGTLAFSPDGRHVASGSSDRTVKVWDNATGDIIKTLAGHPDELLGLTFSQDGKQLVSASKKNLESVGRCRWP